jgi:hypothetical protein
MPPRAATAASTWGAGGCRGERERDLDRERERDCERARPGARREEPAKPNGSAPRGSTAMMPTTTFLMAQQPRADRAGWRRWRDRGRRGHPIAKPMPCRNTVQAWGGPRLHHRQRRQLAAKRTKPSPWCSSWRYDRLEGGS